MTSPLDLMPLGARAGIVVADADDPRTDAVAVDSVEDPAGSGVTGADLGGLDDSGPRRRSSWRRWGWRVGGLVAAFALGVGAFAGWRAINNDQKALTRVSGTQMQKDAAHPGFVTFTDAETGFRLQLPASWSTRVAGTSDVRLIAGPADDDLMSVRVVTLDTGTPHPTPMNLKPYFDAIVHQPTTTILQESKTSLDDVPGWYYVYTFKDASSGRVGLHAQYFLLRGTRLYSVVFQALPKSDFTKLAPAYQQVANSISFF